MAGDMLAAADAGEGQQSELVVISDMQRSNWTAPNLASLPAKTQIHLESVAPAEPLANLAVLRAGVSGSLSQGKESRLEVEIGNFSPTARQITCEVVLGPAAYRLEGSCPANSKKVLSREVPLE